MHGPKRMRRAHRSCSMTEVVSRALGAARWSSRTERAAGPKPGDPGLYHGSRLGVDRHWHGRTVSQISRAVSSSASARGSPSSSARGGSYPGSQSHSAAASRSISPSTVSRRHGRRASCSLRRWRRPSYRGTDRLRFPWRWVPLPWQQGWRPPPRSGSLSPTRCSRRRCGTSTSRGSSRSGGARALGPHRGASGAHRRSAA